MVHDFQAVIAREAREQILAAEKRLPTHLFACVGGGSNSIGLFHQFLGDPQVKMIGIEAGGRGGQLGEHAARLAAHQGFVGARPGVLQGTYTYVLQNEDGQIATTHSISARLDSPAIGPEQAWLADQRSAEYSAVSDQHALAAARMLSELLNNAVPETLGAIILINMLTHVESVNGTHSLEDCMKIPEEFREAANDYELRAKTAMLLRKKFTLKTPYDLAGETRIVGSKAKPASATGTDSVAKISSGVFYLSPVGFDANHTHAITYANYICGNRCGWGGFHLLVNNAGRWEEAKDVTACTWHY